MEYFNGTQTPFKGGIVNNSHCISDEVTLTVLDECVFSRCLIERGRKVKYHNGRHWVSHPWGFYRPVHWLDEFSVTEAVRPSFRSWGFRVTLNDADASMANSSMPVHMIRDLHDYSLSSLSPRRRNKLRNCWKQAEIICIDNPDLLYEQGYRVFRSAQSRTGYGRSLNRQQYQREVERYYNSKQGLIIGALINGNLGGYIMLHAVDNTAYIEDVHLDTSYLHSNIGIGLLFECLQICRRSIGVHRVVHGLHTPENKSLCDFKQGLGFQVIQVPSFIWFMPLVNTFIKVTRPEVYYRLTGHFLKAQESYT